MYTLYFIPGACSLATQVVLREMGQAVQLVNKENVENFGKINPVGSVPVLESEGELLREGVAIILQLLDRHENSLMPTAGEAKSKALENLLFANATMHPAYGRLFFLSQHLNDGAEKDQALLVATDAINHLWQVVEQKLEDHRYLGGERVSAADILLAVYSRWGEFFPVDIKIGVKAREMLDSVIALPSFQAALDAEAAASKAA